MPTTRRKRATSPEENADRVAENATQASESTISTVPTTQEANSPENNDSPAAVSSASEKSARPVTRRVRREHVSQPARPSSQAQETQGTQQLQVQPTQSTQPTHIPAFQTDQAAPVSPLSSTDQLTLSSSPSFTSTNGERPERNDYTPTIEPGRRTARGELFRRPPQIPSQHTQPTQSNQQQMQQVQQVQQAQVAPQVQSSQSHTYTQRTLTPPTPTHEINLPLGNLLHLAYNPGYTGAEEARSALLHKLVNESKAGGRARCWNCGSLAVAYDRWNTRSKTFGEIGVAMCEICGVWSVM